MLRLIYTFVYYLCAPLLCFRWVYKSFKPPQYREPMRERFGFVRKQMAPSIWFHAVSMGESNAAKAIIENLLKDDPSLNIVVTTTTPTGARQIIDGLGERVTHHYSPCDLPGTIKRFTRRIRPKVLIIMETELWPNWLNQMDKAGVPVILANARMSENSAKKYLKVGSLSREMMGAFYLVLAVGEDDRARFVRLGVSPEKTLVTGNIKFDQTFEENGRPSYYPLWQENSAPVWLAASTHRGEDEIILQAHEKVLKQIPDAKLVIVPRHPERFNEVAKLIESHKLSYARRSEENTWQVSVQILLGDTMGELMMAYKLADVAFVGGSLVSIGGHNMIEPASLGKPIISGSHVHNFKEIFGQLKLKGAALTADNADSISSVVVRLLGNPEERIGMGLSAKAVVEQSHGALDKTVEALKPFL
ncbi:lipid IV(A) 3-deoxy-D-manno-octulosonic acid transferase [Kangiella sediminilitoris]|uniref:3-deoxy-D-manno-octulosonic acid transferase n=1 Tax=Kangiella sediminilitoris TaxID=1144748 RepID=A0A1B3B906_9GAMM|nr:lipid IV(A) 3-deoxy-D-manno-octulosonic acid transferase [Kangiella sediminilitoris]AOE49273.1 3-deoxy-D-manno-octulosonic acid transferase [Kangiella sediminilitoris]